MSTPSNIIQFPSPAAAPAPAGPYDVLPKNTTVVYGQRVYSGLYGGRYGIVVAIRGEQRPASVQHLAGGVVGMGGNAEFDILFQSHFSQGLPECILRGVQWDILAGIATEAEIADLRVLRGSDSDAKQAAANVKQLARAAAREKALAANPTLARYDRSSRVGQHAVGAANIRKLLKAAFPGQKFSVTSRTYSGGDSIDIKWKFGPKTAAVEAITKRFQEGSFNGMEDIYETNSDNVWPDLFGGAKYVFAQRDAYDILAATEAAVAQTMRKSEGESDHSYRMACDRIAREIIGGVQFKPESGTTFAPGFVPTKVVSIDLVGTTWVGTFA